MYTIIIAAAFLLADYLQRTRRVLAGRIIAGVVIAAGFVVSFLAVEDHRWWNMFSSFMTAWVIIILVELYMTKLAHFEIKK